MNLSLNLFRGETVPVPGEGFGGKVRPATPLVV